MVADAHPAPKFASNEGMTEAFAHSLGAMLLVAKEEHGEIVLTVERDRVTLLHSVATLYRRIDIHRIRKRCHH